MALTRNRLLLAGTETTYGTPVALAGTDALKISELDVEPIQIDLIDRELITPYFGNTQKVVGSEMVGITFSCEIAGSGAAGTPPRWGKVLRACGFTEAIDPGVSVTYTPTSSSFESCTMDFYADAVRHVVAGVRGTVTLTFETGSLPRLEFEMMGLYTEPTDTPLPAVTFGDQADPQVVNSIHTSAVDIFGYAACLQNLSVSNGGEVVYRQLAGCSRQVRLTDRKPEGEISIEAPTLAQKNYFSTVSSQTLGNVSLTHGTNAGNIVAFAAPSSNLGGVNYGDSDGVMLLEMPFMPNPVTGNDEYQIVLT